MDKMLKQIGTPKALDIGGNIKVRFIVENHTQATVNEYELMTQDFIVGLS